MLGCLDPPASAVKIHAEILYRQQHSGRLFLQIVFSWHQNPCIIGGNFRGEDIRYQLGVYGGRGLPQMDIQLRPVFCRLRGGASSRQQDEKNAQDKESCPFTYYVHYLPPQPPSLSIFRIPGLYIIHGVCR